MQKDIESYIIPPAPKSLRGYLSFLDVSSDYLLFFNANTLVLLPHDSHKSVLNVNHLSDVAAAKFSPDARLVASIENKGTLIISQIVPDKVITFKQYQNIFPNAKSIDWTADRKRLCIVGQGKNSFGRVILIETGTNAGEIIGVGATLNSCSFRPQRPFKLVLGGDQNSLKFYDGPPYAFVKSDRPHNGYINQIKFSPKGVYLVSGGADRKLVLYDGVKLEKIVQKQNAHNGGIFGLDWIDDQHFVSCSSDKLIKVWDVKLQQKFVVETGSQEDIKNPKKINLFLVAVRVFENLIYAANLEGDILVYLNPFYEGKKELVRKISGSKSKIIKILPVDLDQIILLDSGGRILHHHIPSKQTTPIKLQIDIKLIIDGFKASDKQSTWLYILLQDGSVAIYANQLQSQNFAYFKTISKYQSKYISNFSQKDHFVGINNDKLFIINTSKNQVVRQKQFQDEASSLKSNANTIVVGTNKGRVFIFNSNLELIFQSVVKTFKISIIQFIPSLTAPQTFLILIGDSCGNMQLLQVQNNKLQVIKESMGGHSSLITAVDYDDKWIYTFSMDGKINVWNRQNIRRVNQIQNIVKGGILFGISLSNHLIVAGGDLLTRIVQKKN